MKLAKRDIRENKRGICQLLRSTARTGIDGLIDWLDSGADFFIAPASSIPGRHGCYEGGLAQHSLNVYGLFLEKAGQYGLGLEDDEIIISSLLHDLCKAGFYRQNILKNGRVSEAKPYTVEDCFPFGHGEKSVYLASKYIELTKNEALLIRWHMGPFDSQWEFYGDKVIRECPAVVAFHSADYEASVYLDGKKLR